MAEKTWKIYLLICLITHKGYVGQTHQNIEQRCSYKSSYSSGRIKNDFTLYGPDNFVCIILEDGIDTQELADERERYWITFCNTSNPDVGYNVQIGGKSGHTGGFSYDCKHGSTPKKVVQYTKDMKRIRTWESAKEASKELGISVSSIRSCCMGNQITAGKYKWKSI